MLDIHFIRENKARVAKAIADKAIQFDLEKLLSLSEKRKKLQQSLEAYRRERNEMSDRIGQEGDKGAREKLIATMRQKKGDGKKLEEKLSLLEAEFRSFLLRVPNIVSEDTPIGPNESENVEIAKWGDPPNFSFLPLSHIELGERLKLLDFDRGVKVQGFRGYFLKNELAVLHWALLWHTLKKMREKGFEVMVPPTMVKKFSLVGSGHFTSEDPKDTQVSGYGDVFHIPDRADGGDGWYLAGTSEIALLAYRADEIIDESELPLKYCGLSQCYRREVGTYGKDVKGLYRIHEFTKVEQVVICQDDLSASLPLFEEIKENALELLRELELPHRVLAICTGDMGLGKYKMYDIETWMPSRNSYGETHSNSHLTDWQSRRVPLRYRKTNGEIAYPHTMNNTEIASPRILVALLENYQQEDGSILVPKVLQPYCGFDRILPK